VGWLAGSVAAALPWLLLRAAGAPVAPEWTALLAGLGILGAAFLLSWATELAERDIPQSLALLVLALVSVLPEYAVDLHFAIQAGRDPRYAHYAVANMTGANRLLIGFGWAAVALVAVARTGGNAVHLRPHHRLELRFLLLATLYSFFVPLSGTLNLFDAAVLLALFGWYVVAASRGESEEVELVGPAAWLDARLSERGRRACAAGLLVFAASAIFLSAEPFAEGLVHIGRNYAVDEFLLVQWVAPLASESPEFTIAILFALRRRGPLGMGALVSAKVNQWTLLVGALPVAYSLSAGTWKGLPLDARQTEELLLTSAQSLLAALLLAELRLTRLEAVVLAALFAVQLVFPSAEVRVAFAVLYLALFVGLLIHSPSRRRAFLGLLRGGA
jgi:cation:H+ antiporter